jgi:hypothetical protein
MYELTVKTCDMVFGRINGEERIKFMDRATARAMCDIYLDCEDVYCVEMTNAHTGELLFYEMKN